MKKDQASSHKNIPKTIHYCWFGKSEKSQLINECLESWKKHCPDFTIIEWNEKNYDINTHPFIQQMYKKKKWAFVSDYARLDILHKYGGVYLDTDMLLIKNISPLLENTSLVLGKESPQVISAGFIAGVSDHVFFKDALKEYDNISNITTPETIPRILTRLVDINKYSNCIILEPIIFYPFTVETISKFNKGNPPAKSYGVHLWNFSWGKWYQRLLHKTKLYKFIKEILKRIGVLIIIKKILHLS